MRKASKPPSRYPRNSKAHAPKRSVAPGLTPNVRKVIVAGAKAGVPWPVVASRACVSTTLIRKWRTHGQMLSETFATTGALPETATADDLDCLRLYDELEVAHNAAVEMFTKTIAKAGKKNWVAAAWWLERRAPEFFRVRKPPEDVKPEDSTVKSKGEVMLYLPDNGRDPQ